MDYQGQDPHHNTQQKMGKRMIFISWVFLLSIFVFLFSWYQDKIAGENNTKEITSTDGTRELHIPISNDSYRVFGSLNNTKVLFLVDTGATSIAIPESIANKARLPRGMSLEIITAGGRTTAYYTTIDKLYIGENIVLYNVRATINPRMSSDLVLLGMGALKQLDFSQTRDVLILKQMRY